MTTETTRTDIRPAREYQVYLEDDSDGDRRETFTVPTGTEAEQDAAAKATATQLLEEWVNQGDWGDDGARVNAWYTLEDETSEWPRKRVVVDVEPNHDKLMEQAGADPDCDHEWSSEDEGGCDDNPGVWATGGTSFTFCDHCVHCGLRRTQHVTGSQYNPGEYDTVEYEMPDDEAGQ